ncbi:phospho-sugar mutase [Mammaliicoccus lentus]|uniref:phospho-sugar mutase n=1 Tax=Mammaliicoccus lentus TaxID=42858 RepID=UPI000305C8DA|nr:phospho-sugar mutase [Mammaliicoccus lentus]
MKQAWEDKLSESLVESFHNELTEQEIDEGFQDTLAFGTAGIRSTFGIGPGRLNKFTIQKFALGFANYLKDISDEPKVIIHFDTRYLSKEFSEEIAKVLGTHGVIVVLPDTYKSTPELSFAVCHLNTTAGIMITASHNPKNYNGIKVYGADGGQLLTEPSLKLSEYIDQVNDPLNIKVNDLKTLKENNIVIPFENETTEAYKKAVCDLVGAFKTQNSKTVLSSLHGTSLPILSDILHDLSYDHFVIETSQSEPDSDFPTVNIANPEMEDTFDLGKELADKESANLIVATDPDADRLGIVERYENGTTRYFNGNEIGLLLLKLRHDELQSTKSYMIKSVVTGALSEKLAEHLHIDVINVLTGFKYISEQLKALENDQAKLVLAFEESHGYLLNDFSRDKDAIQTAALLIKYKEQLTQEKQTFKDVLETIYETLGYYQDKTLSPSFKGMEGKAQIKQIMEHFNNLTTIEVGELKPLFIENYIKQERTNIETGEQSKIDLPQADLIKFIFEEGFIAVRPSGTEPKMKLYFSLDVEDFNGIVEEFLRNYNLKN